MNDADIERVVTATLAKQPSIDEAVEKTVGRVLQSLGIETEDHAEMRADMLHLRKWRKSVERVETVGWNSAITVIIGGVLGALWLGVKAALGK